MVPPEVLKLEMLEDSWHSRPVRSFGVGTLDADMSLGQMVAQVYSRAYELDRSIGLEKILLTKFEDHADAIGAAFTERRDARSTDKEIFRLVDQSRSASKKRFLASVIEGEKERTKDFSEEITRILDPEELEVLVGDLVKLHRFDAFKITFVSDSFGLTPSQVSEISKIGRTLATNIFKLDPMEVNDAGRRLAAQSFLQRFRTMESEQIRRYFECLEQLEKGANISEVGEFYPEGFGPLIEDLYDSKVREGADAATE
ncbi:hypothetical protein CEE69_30870 [Rhodopirellula bahusiensis]|uniref:Uncharacterized protein n=1 Tax=Rhodopirellula bahusiensis TaxID=2014065 RepID=A0A2G1VXI8_9BACT|nr:hypothetical protein CEE69_30870 [Rhodopirellula bahusiensis]